MARSEVEMLSCGECGVEEGGMHEIGCQREMCPVCGKVLVNCICYEHFKTGNSTCPFCKSKIGRCECGSDVIFEWNDVIAETMHPSAIVDPRTPYIKYIGSRWWEDAGWLVHLDELGRNHHVHEPNLCFRCGKKWPSFFHVPDDEWKSVVPVNLRRKILCKKCYDEVKDGAAKYRAKAIN